jgi:hypothetical protein
MGDPRVGPRVVLRERPVSCGQLAHSFITVQLVLVVIIPHEMRNRRARPRPVRGLREAPFRVQGPGP